MSVYFVQSGEGGRIKIGYAGIPKWRIAYLRRFSGPDLVLLALIDGSRTLEGKLHRLMAASHAHDEWFDPTPEVLSLVGRAKLLPQDGGGLSELWRIEFTDEELVTLARGVGVIAELAAEYRDCRSRAYGDALAGLLRLGFEPQVTLRNASP